MCHLDRQRQYPLTPEDAISASKAARNIRRCAHPEASRQTCTTIAKAHSIQRSGAGLESIAERGHVYGHKIDAANITRTPRRVQPELIGIGQASTFSGFCGRHDSELFKPIDQLPFKASAEQLTLFGYRALCKELMAQESALAMSPMLREMDRGKPMSAQITWQRRMMLQEAGFSLGINDLRLARRDFEAAIASRDYSAIHALVVLFDRIPAVHATSPLTPEFDFDGNLLQDRYDFDRPMKALTFTMTGTGQGGGIAIFSWMTESDAALRFCESVQRIPKELLAHRLVQFAFEYFENVYWSPAWWESLDSDTKTQLVERMNAQIHTDRSSDCLRDDGTRAADWRVVSISRF